MTGKGLKTKILATFAMMLVMAMCLQSMVFIFLGIRTSIQEDIAWTKKTLQTFARFATIAEDVETQRFEFVTINESLQEECNQAFTCYALEVEGQSTTGKSLCRFPQAMLKKAEQAKKSKNAVVGFAGSEWNVFLFRSEAFLIAVPLINSVGQVIGTISVERSLLPLYSRYQEEAWVALFYLLVNLTIFIILSFFRMEYILFRPLDRLVQKAENYNPDQQSLFLASDDESAFRKLSVSFNALLDRIERDNKKLRKSISELENANRELKDKNELVVRSEKLASVGRLSAGLAHEIGNPLSIIQGYVALLSREDLTGDEKKQFSDKAQQELDRIRRLIRQLLDFAGPMHSTVAPASVNALIKDVIGFVSMEKTFAGCSIVTDLHAEHDEIVTDKDALRQVLINCLFNAADATTELGDQAREIVVATYLQKDDAIDGLLVISIKDNGLGIDEAHLGYIFDPFFTTKEVGRGTGLGLFVCHTIMERLGGAITLCNRTPVGVEVRLEIPIQQKF